MLQGSYINLKVTDKISFPVASLSLFENVSLLLLIPLMDRVIFPGLRRLGFEFTPLRRIGVGLLFAAGSVVMAGIIEIERKHILETHGAIKQDVFDKQVNASSMSVFYQVPQYILQGTSEALVSVTGTIVESLLQLNSDLLSSEIQREMRCTSYFTNTMTCPLEVHLYHFKASLKLYS